MPVDVTGEWSPQHLGQPRNRQQNRKRVAVDEYDAGVRIDRAKRPEGKDVVRTFKHPMSWHRRLVLQVL